MHRFFLNPDQLTGDRIVLEGEVAHQISRVLRLGQGSHILLLDGNGNEIEVSLLDVPKNGPVSAGVVERRQATGEPGIKITLYQAMLKGEKFEWVLQKGTEIGISKFVPVISERSIGESARLERWRKIIREAAEQSRRGLIPELTPPVQFNEVLQIMSTSSLPMIAWEEEKSLSLRQMLDKVDRPDGEVALLVGPEGGFSSNEVQKAINSKIHSVTLGPRILRAETAGPVMAALILFRFGELD